jgi:hypothetical protein
VFDPVDGILSLRRLTIDSQPTDLGSYAIRGTSLSLPSSSGVGRLNTSSNAALSGATRSQTETPSELVAKETLVATFSLRRGGHWKEVMNIVQMRPRQGAVYLAKPEYGFYLILQMCIDCIYSWLAQAELSTFSASPRVLPRSIYLSRQFSFHALEGDYHALVRRFRLDILNGTRLTVRKEIPVNAYTGSGTGVEPFVQEFQSAPQDVRRAPSSFDEPLASALSGDLDHSLPSSPVLPMLPNGQPRSFKGSVPIRAVAAGAGLIGDGVSEGFGRIRKRASARMVRSSVPEGRAVSLEFGEEEEGEDFAGEEMGILRRSESVSVSGTSMSISTPSTTGEAVRVLDPDDFDASEYVWNAWGATDGGGGLDRTVGQDDVSAVGLLDEEQGEGSWTGVGGQVFGGGYRNVK